MIKGIEKIISAYQSIENKSIELLEDKGEGIEIILDVVLANGLICFKDACFDSRIRMIVNKVIDTSLPEDHVRIKVGQDMEKVLSWYEPPKQLPVDLLTLYIEVVSSKGLRIGLEQIDGILKSEIRAKYSFLNNIKIDFNLAHIENYDISKEDFIYMLIQDKDYTALDSIDKLDEEVKEFKDAIFLSPIKHNMLEEGFDVIQSVISIFSMVGFRKEDIFE